GKIGPAPVTPEESRSGVRSKLPTQTPTVTSRVYPTVQLAWYACDVPVFTATGNGNSRLPPRPNTHARALSSLRMSVMKKAARGDSTAEGIEGDEAVDERNCGTR